MPKVVRVNLAGELQPWVTAKDVILELLRRRSVKGGPGKVMEYVGSALERINSSYRDLQVVAEVLKGKHLAPNLHMYLGVKGLDRVVAGRTRGEITSPRCPMSWLG
jgi:homoaconitase/3-isopropylmalate dehydratase large subunit